MKTQKRRRLKGKTDYKKRLNLLKSEKPRVVCRRTNKYFLTQYIISEESKDKVLITIRSKELINYGWPKEDWGSLKSLTAGYLTGYLIGKKIINKKLEIPIVDFGMQRVLHGKRVFSFLKGLIDSGLKIKCDEKCFPAEERIMGKHLKKDFSEIFNKVKMEIEKNA